MIKMLLKTEVFLTINIVIIRWKIDTLVNNAGIGAFPVLGEITENDLLSVYNTNVFGMALLTQEFLPQFEQNSGNIINIEEPLVKRFCTRFSFRRIKICS
jgi:short-subunit dehydrogenase